MNNSKKALQKALAAVVFDPRKPGTLSTIVEGASSDYLLERGIEVLRDAKRFHGIERWAKVRDGIAILAYAMTLEAEQTTAHKPCVRCKAKWLAHVGLSNTCPDNLGTYKDPDRGS